MDLGRTLLRGTVGPLMVGHGTQKLFGWFGGHGLEGTGGAFESMGRRPGRRHATAAGAAETLCGALLTLGALTPVASTMLSSVMITAIRKVHLQNGPWVTGGGWEYNAVLMGAAAALVETGPGRPSVDAALFPRLKGNGWVLASLAAGAAGSWLVTERFSEAAPEAAPAEDTTLERDPRFARETTETPADVT
ncbi:MAG: putative oxidoreductase [Solirubrobacteraceae bacterium]|nr:putative oxidoreductase [Solirubrobacteraceae bacterium]